MKGGERRDRERRSKCVGQAREFLSKLPGPDLARESRPNYNLFIEEAPRKIT